jgi:hypothetical protein
LKAVDGGNEHRLTQFVEHEYIESINVLN